MKRRFKFSPKWQDVSLKQNFPLKILASLEKKGTNWIKEQRFVNKIFSADIKARFSLFLRQSLAMPDHPKMLAQVSRMWGEGGPSGPYLSFPASLFHFSFFLLEQIFYQAFFREGFQFDDGRGRKSDDLLWKLRLLCRVQKKPRIYCKL